MVFRILIGLLMLAMPGAAFAAQAQTAMPVRIEITSGWGGLGQIPPPTHVIITGTRSGYHDQSGPVDPGKIAGLMMALRAPAIPKPSLAALGIDQAWLDRNVGAEQPWKYEIAFGTGPNQIALYRAALSDPPTIALALKNHFASFHTDDYPRICVTMRFADGIRLSATSTSQNAFMLPWAIGHAQSYDVRISRAIVALLPANAVNRDRIAGENVPNLLAHEVMRQIVDKWNLLDARNRAGATLALLSPQFRIDSAEINPYHHLEYGTAWREDLPYAEAERAGERNLHLTLHRPGMPANLAIAAVLKFENGKPQNANGLLSAIGQYERLVLSVPWLADFIRHNPEHKFAISFVHDASMGDKAFDSFTKDMTAIRRPDLIAAVVPVRKQAALVLASDDGYWIVLPDKRTIFWRYESRAALLGWNEKSFKTRECDAYYATVTGGCVGAVIALDGVTQR